MSNGSITKNEFLTKTTTEGLRISLQSTIDLVNYLLNDCNFSYVLTGKLNQDCLEVGNVFPVLAGGEAGNDSNMIGSLSLGTPGGFKFTDRIYCII